MKRTVKFKERVDPGLTWSDILFGEYTRSFVFGACCVVLSPIVLLFSFRRKKA